jgi:c-di-GMP-binding flagellar brake protein YcgR
MRTPFPELPKSRRKTSRVEAPEVRVYWSSGGRNDLLRVRNLSLGGMFVETRNPESVGSTEQINFLVEEGQIRTKAVVRHIKNASGMGLQTPPSGGSTDQTSCVGAVPSQPTSLTGSP